MVDTLINVGGFLLLAGIVLTIVIRRAVRRDRLWPAAAASLGLTYARSDDGLLQRFDGFKILDAVGVRYLSNVASGTRGWFKVWLGDYKYSSHLTGTVASHGFTLCVLQNDRLDVPHVFLESKGRPRSMTLAPQLRRPDDDPAISLDEDSEFSRSFTLSSASPDAALKLLTPALRELLVKILLPYLNVEAKGHTLIVTRRSWIEPRDAAVFVDAATAIGEELLKSTGVIR